jgi:type II secretory pathway pseudopilin PulG
MDRNYIENEHIVDRYLSGDLTVREARDFEKYCLEHPEVLNQMPIPVRLKARLARRPLEHSETGMFQAIPSSATRAAVEANDEGFDAEEERAELRRTYGGGANRLVVIGLVFALLAAVAGLIAYGMQASDLAKQLKQAQRDLRSTQMQAPASVQVYRVQPVRNKPDQATLALGWMVPPQLLDLIVDVSDGKYSQFQLTIDKIDGGRIMQLRRVARDSNRELRFSLNSSAFGPGEYLIKVDGYTWRGQIEEIGWLRLGLQ